MLFTRVQPGGQISAADFNRMLDEIERWMLNLYAEPPMEVQSSDAGAAFRLNVPRRLFARITGLLPESGSGGGSGAGSGSGSGSGPDYCFPAYTWTAQVAEETCLADNAADIPGDETLPALCLTGREDVPTDGETIVELIQAPGWPYFVFFWGVSAGAGGLGSGGLSGSGCSDSLPINQCNLATGTTVQKTLTAYDADGRPITFCVS